MFIAALFTIAKTWKKPKCPLTTDKEDVVLLGTHTEKTRIERDTCTPVFITALFTIARTWKEAT